MAYHTTTNSPYMVDDMDMGLEAEGRRGQPSHSGAFTPSFASSRSYQNSPYSDFVPFNENETDLEADFGDISIRIQDTSGEGEGGVGLGLDGSYDPSDYDAPGDNMLGFDTDNFMDSFNPHHSSVGPPGSPFDHGSPASSAGDGIGNTSGSNDGGGHFGARGIMSRSRASSISSNHGGGIGVNPALTTGPGGGTDLTSTFNLEHMTFNSPSPGPTPALWPHPMPSAQSPPGMALSTSSGSNKPQSPPSLYIPGPEIIHTAGTPSPTLSVHSETHSSAGSVNTRLIGSSQGGLMPGPGIHIVPATPVSGGASQGDDPSFQDILGESSTLILGPLPCPLCPGNFWGVHSGIGRIRCLSLTLPVNAAQIGASWRNGQGLVWFQTIPVF